MSQNPTNEPESVPRDGLAAGLDERAADGRMPGRRGLATRQRLLDATAEQLESCGYRDLKVIDIARSAGTSPATFYQYFPDAEAAVLVKAAVLTEAWHEELRLLISERDWSGNPDAAALEVVDGFLTFWTDHRAILKVLDLASMEGDFRFRDLRTWLLNGATNSLMDLVEAHGSDMDPKAAAGVIIAMLAHVANHRPGLERWGVDHDALVATVAGILRHAVIG
ncbi:MAG: TetR/AcrR family transcriptional regulator [Actinobacteria bacterium]|nr:TetR/AcrR family transcriptional regulator [Actinomycetota bacterium]